METPNLSFSPYLIPAAALLYGFIHSLIAANGFKHHIYRILGDGAKRYYRLFYSIFAVITLLPVLILTALIPDETLYSIPAPWVYLTTALQIISVGLIIYSVMQTGALQFIGLSQAFGRDNKESLNTGGLYRYVRHPLYTFSLVVIWLTPKLVQTFGPAYQEYRRKTPFLIPFIF
jgi:protein-S-isoprenylcysteine O-methyltransferase Ste14